MTALLDARVVFGQGANSLLRSAGRRTRHSHVWHRGSLGELRQHVPGPFTLAPFRHGDKTNPLLQVVCNADGLPLGVVSSSYALLDHGDLVDSLVHSLDQCGLDTTEYPAEMYVGDGGASFGLRLVFSDLVYDPGDGHPVAGRVELLNSVNRTLPFRLIMGFFRFVCSNGLVVGESVTNLLEIHRKGRVDVPRLREVVAESMRRLQEGSAIFRTMHRTVIPDGFSARLLAAVTGAWGEREAQAVQVALVGGTYQGVQVPGMIAPVETLWGVYNALTWIAGRSRDLVRQVTMGGTAHRIMEETIKIYGIKLN
jgi:hypothetical protein